MLFRSKQSSSFQLSEGNKIISGRQSLHQSEGRHGKTQSRSGRFGTAWVEVWFAGQISNRKSLQNERHRQKRKEKT